MESLDDRPGPEKRECAATTFFESEGPFVVFAGTTVNAKKACCLVRTRLRSRNSQRFVSRAKYSPNVSLAANDLPTVARRASGFLFLSSECALEKSETVTPLPSLRISADRTKEDSLFKEPMCSGHRPQRFLRRSDCIAVSASTMSEPSCVTRWASKYTESLGLPLSVRDVEQRHSRSCCPAIPWYMYKLMLLRNVQ